MFTKAISPNDDLIFYFDGYDNKYVAKGGSVAWRTNNPGLVHSHSIIRHRSIGSYGQIAIFSSPKQGERALYGWLHCKKYCRSTLIAIAKYYEPKNPENFLKKLGDFTNLKNDVILSSFSKKEFQTLIWGIKQLAGYSSRGDEEFHVLPKISARFYSKKASVESYLIGSDQFLSKVEAIRWVEEHRLDAVIVHKNDGSMYLRSRPGHHLQKIHLNQKDYGKDFDFEDIVREVGTKKSGQCVWAFINGIWNSKEGAMASASKISAHVGGELVWSLVNDTKVWPIGDVVESLAFKLGIESKVVQMAIKFFRFLIKLSHDKANRPPIVIIAHSQGAMISELASRHLNSKERQKLRIFTFGGWAFIPPDRCHNDTHNFFSPYDVVAKGGSPNISLLLLRLEEGKRRGLRETDIIEEIITEDQDYYLDTQNSSAIEAFRRQRKKHYVQLLKKASNVTLLQEYVSEVFEHSFDRECYQKKLKTLLGKYKS